MVDEKHLYIQFSFGMFVIAYLRKYIEPIIIFHTILQASITSKQPTFGYSLFFEKKTLRIKNDTLTKKEKYEIIDSH